MIDPVSELGEPFVALGCKYVRLDRATSVVDRLVGELVEVRSELADILAGGDGVEVVLDGHPYLDGGGRFLGLEPAVGKRTVGQWYPHPQGWALRILRPDVSQLARRLGAARKRNRELVAELEVARATVEGCASPVVREVVAEVERAKSLHPRWPDDNPFEGLAVLTEEVGELAQALLDRKNGRFPSVREEVEAKAAVLVEAVQVAAMGLRLLESLSREGVSDV